MTVPSDARTRADFDTIYRTWFPHVCRWVRALGGLGIDYEDQAQEVFIVVRRKLSSFDGRNLGGWLYRIAELTVRRQRTRPWFKNMILNRRPLPSSELIETRPGPASELQSKEARGILATMLSAMDENRRVAFVLFEIEGYSGEEIAELQAIPVATVWTRLHYARKEFVAAVAEYREREAKRGTG